MSSSNRGNKYVYNPIKNKFAGQSAVDAIINIVNIINQ